MPLVPNCEAGKYRFWWGSLVFRQGGKNYVHSQGKNAITPLQDAVKAMVCGAVSTVI